MSIVRVLTGFAIGALALAFGSTAAEAHEGGPIHESGVSAGFAVGDITGFDMKLWFAPHHGFDLGIGADAFSDRLALYGEAELSLAEWGMGSNARGIFYFGPGVEAVIHDPGDDYIALMAPIGFDFQFRAPLDIFVELRPGLALADSDFVIGGQGGLRVVF